jgi:LPXTG-motif cell wall-anchored protein
VAATSGSVDSGTTDPGTTTGDVAPSNDVKGDVVLPDQLPRTGDSDASLAIIGSALVLIGGGMILIRRNLVPGS